MLNFSDRLKLYKKENCLDVSLGSVSFRVPDPVGSGKNLRHVVVINGLHFGRNYQPESVLTQNNSPRTRA